MSRVAIFSVKRCGGSDSREMLDKEQDVDAVTVIVPDHMHATCVPCSARAGNRKPIT